MFSGFKLRFDYAATVKAALVEKRAACDENSYELLKACNALFCRLQVSQSAVACHDTSSIAVLKVKSFE
jgi:hypothetical protein